MRNERGLGLISAIALIVLVSVICAALARAVQQNAATDATGLLRVRALARPKADSSWH